jgi:peptide deformylase
MAKVLPLRYWNDPVLSAVCEPVGDGEFGPQLEEFGRDLVATMTAKNGVGLAAPQVGVTKRVFAMAFPDHRDLEPAVVCNPELRLTGSTVYGQEGCLSLPDVYQQVYRASSAFLRYRTPDGKTVELPLGTPWDARVAQHEYDHLNGIMFFNYLDKREEFATEEHPEPWGARMSKQMCKAVLREWDSVREKKGL